MASKMVRRSHEKSRRGCLTCKRRRVKCDETRPFCLNCTRRSVTCEYASSPTGEGGLAKVPSVARQPATLSAGEQSEQIQLATPSSTDTDTGRSPLSQARQHEHSESEPRGAEEAIPRVDRACSSYSSAAQDSCVFDALDLELMHQYTAVVSKSFADDSVSLRYWQYGIPQNSFKSTAVRHAMLALTGWHQVHHVQEQPYRSRAEHHASVAVSAMIELLGGQEHQALESLYMASMIMSFSYLAKGPQAGEYLAFSDFGSPEWLNHLRGVRSLVSSIKETGKMRKAQGWVDGIAEQKLQGEAQDERYWRTPILCAAVPDHEGPLEKLYTFISDLAAEGADVSRYTTAINSLRDSYRASFENRTRDGAAEIRQDQIWAWLYRMEDDFITALHQKRPPALIIYAHFVVLLAQVQQQWYLTGWIPHIMSGIKRHLNAVYHGWLEWPDAEIDRFRLREE